MRSAVVNRPKQVFLMACLSRFIVCSLLLPVLVPRPAAGGTAQVSQIERSRDAREVNALTLENSDIRAEHRRKRGIERDQAQFIKKSGMPTAYANGSRVSRNSQREFELLCSHTEVTPAISQLLQEPVGEINAPEFVLPNDWQYKKLFYEDGTLQLDPCAEAVRQLPVADQQGLRQLGRCVKGNWNRLAKQLWSGQPIRESAAYSWKQSIRQLREAFQPLRPEQNNEALRRARRHVDLLLSLANHIVREEIQSKLRWSFRGEDFPGGTLGELIRFLQQHRVGVQYGSPESILLAEFVYEAKRQRAQHMGFGDETSGSGAAPSYQVARRD